MPTVRPSWWRQQSVQNSAKSNIWKYDESFKHAITSRIESSFSTYTGWQNRRQEQITQHFAKLPKTDCQSTQTSFFLLRPDVIVDLALASNQNAGVSTTLILHGGRCAPWQNGDSTQSAFYNGVAAWWWHSVPAEALSHSSASSVLCMPHGITWWYRTGAEMFVFFLHSSSANTLHFL